jgi:hypothetical protein
MESTMSHTPVVQTPAVPAVADEAGPVRNLIDQTTANLIARVNAVSLTGEELMLASAEVHKLPLETCNREARTRCLAEVFKGRRGKASVANLRLEALAQLVHEEKIPRCWVRPTMLRDCVFSAAATEPLLFTANNEPFFDAESFVAFLLETEADGRA